MKTTVHVNISAVAIPVLMKSESTPIISMPETSAVLTLLEHMILLKFFITSCIYYQVVYIKPFIGTRIVAMIDPEDSNWLG